jgi:hypothetical protein
VIGGDVRAVEGDDEIGGKTQESDGTCEETQEDEAMGEESEDGDDSHDKNEPKLRKKAPVARGSKGEKTMLGKRKMKQKPKCIKRKKEVEQDSEQVSDEIGKEIQETDGVFHPDTPDTMRKILGSMNPKSCDLDPIPTWLLKQCPAAIEMLCTIVNWSLDRAVLPTAHKTAHIRPRLKKSSLDSSEMKNFRPVSNLSFISKLAEKVVAAQLTAYLEENNTTLPLQSAYKALHSTETAIWCEL